MRPTVVKKNAEQAHRRRARDPVPSPAPSYPSRQTSKELPPISARLELPPRHGAPHSIPETQFLSYLGRRSLCLAQQVRHVPSSQGVSQHEPEGPGSDGAEQDGAAGAPVIGMPSLWHLVACTTRLSNVQTYLISYTPLCVTEFLHTSQHPCPSTPMSRC